MHMEKMLEAVMSARAEAGKVGQASSTEMFLQRDMQHSNISFLDNLFQTYWC